MASLNQFQVILCGRVLAKIVASFLFVSHTEGVLITPSGSNFVAKIGIKTKILIFSLKGFKLGKNHYFEVMPVRGSSLEYTNPKGITSASPGQVRGSQK